MPPFDASYDALGHVNAAECCNDVLRSLVARFERHEDAHDLDPWWRVCAGVRESLNLFDGVSARMV